LPKVGRNINNSHVNEYSKHFCSPVALEFEWPTGPRIAALYCMHGRLGHSVKHHLSNFQWLTFHATILCLNSPSVQS